MVKFHGSASGNVKSREFLENGHDDILMSWVYKPILPGLMSFSPIVKGFLRGGVVILLVFLNVP